MCGPAVLINGQIVRKWALLQMTGLWSFYPRQENSESHRPRVTALQSADTVDEPETDGCVDLLCETETSLHTEAA